jgi:hypothetical protein
MAAKRDVLAEIEEIRSRTAAVDDLDSGILKLLAIVTSTQRLKDDGEEDETHTYFVVASIATLESYFRWQIRVVIDSGNARFLNNIRLDEQPVKLNHDITVALLNKRLTVGELVGHTVGFSDFGKIAAFMTKLLGTDFVRLLETTKDPDDDSLVLDDYGQVISDVKLALELRHIICHEGHRMHLVTNAEVKRLASSCYMFVRGCQYAVAGILNPLGPKTRQDRYKETSVQADELRTHLAKLEDAVAEGLRGNMEQDSFRAMQKAWDAYVASEGNFFASIQMNGDQGELDAARTRARLTERRIEDLQQWVDRMEKLSAFMGERPKSS